jgi:hypothetical protein
MEFVDTFRLYGQFLGLYVRSIDIYVCVCDIHIHIYTYIHI